MTTAGAVGEADEVAGEGGQIAQQAGETVHRAAIGGVLASGLGLRRRRDFGGETVQVEGLAAAAAGRS